MSASATDVMVRVGGLRRKILISKLGLDGHDRGAKVVARALRDAGFEVVYLGVHKSPEDVVEAAIEEDVSAIGISILSGSHLELVSNLIKLMRERGINVPLIVGGIIPPEDVNELRRLGVFDVFIPGTPLKKIVEVFERACEVSGS
ncbi:MAG: cobalamin B12-binding domain-containing protein [Zestosphaera sp.]